MNTNIKDYNCNRIAVRRLRRQHEAEMAKRRERMCIALQWTAVAALLAACVISIVALVRQIDAENEERERMNNAHAERIAFEGGRA